MTIYEELIKRVRGGENYDINLVTKSMKIGKQNVVNKGVVASQRELCYKVQNPIEELERLYQQYKYSCPSEKSQSKKNTYFKALSMEELDDVFLITGEDREVARAALEGFVLCMIILGELQWSNLQEKGWFWQSPNDKDLVLLKQWMEGS